MEETGRTHDDTICEHPNTHTEDGFNIPIQASVRLKALFKKKRLLFAKAANTLRDIKIIIPPFP